jgi:hypothetical protein
MPARRATRPRKFTLDQLRHQPSIVARAAKQKGGCIVVDKEGRQVCSIWIPQGRINFHD